MTNSGSVSSTNDNADVVLVWSKNIISLQTSIYEASREIFNNKEVCYILLATGIRFCAGFTIGKLVFAEDISLIIIFLSCILSYMIYYLKLIKLW